MCSTNLGDALYSQISAQYLYSTPPPPCLESVVGHKTPDQLLPGNYAALSAPMYYAFGGSYFHVSWLDYSCVIN